MRVLKSYYLKPFQFLGTCVSQTQSHHTVCTDDLKIYLQKHLTWAVFSIVTFYKMDAWSFVYCGKFCRASTCDRQSSSILEHWHLTLTPAFNPFGRGTILSCKSCFQGYWLSLLSNLVIKNNAMQCWDFPVYTQCNVKTSLFINYLSSMIFMYSIPFMHIVFGIYRVFMAHCRICIVMLLPSCAGHVWVWTVFGNFWPLLGPRCGSAVLATMFLYFSQLCL